VVFLIDTSTTAASAAGDSHFDEIDSSGLSPSAAAFKNLN
jgi:hypothetical protein